MFNKCPNWTEPVKFKIAPRKHESIWNIFFSNNQRPPNNLVFQPLSHCHYCLLCGTLNSIIVSGIVPKQNAFKFIIAPHKKTSIVFFFWQEDPPCLSRPKHNGKSSTVSEPGYLCLFSIFLIVGYKTLCIQLHFNNISTVTFLFKLII